MTDKPAAKKKKAAPKAEKDASDEELKQAVLKAALKDAPFDGFTDSLLAKAGKSAGADKAELARLFPRLQPGRTRTEILPGGDFGTGGMEGFTAALRRDLPWLPEQQLRRYVKLYGTRTRDLLGSAQSLADLGRHFGADLYAREVDYLMDKEWALAADDVGQLPVQAH